MILLDTVKIRFKVQKLLITAKLPDFSSLLLLS